MAEFTPNYNMKKPSDDDFYNVQDFNSNADIVDDELKKQSNRIKATEYPAFTEAEKDENIQSKESLPTLLGKIKRAITKISEHISADNPHSDSAPKKHKHSTEDLESGTLPLSRGGTGANTAAQALKNLGINVGASVINLLDGVKSNIQNQIEGKANSEHSHNAATTSKAGFLSASDKAKLNGIAVGADKTTVDSALSATSTNPVRNSVLTAKINEIVNAVNGKAASNHTHPVDADMSSTSTNPVQNKVVNKALAECQLGSVLAASQMFSQHRDYTINIPSGDSDTITFPRGSAGIAGTAITSATSSMALWYFTSSSGGVAIVPIVSCSKFTATGSLDGNNMVLTFTNNTGKSHPVGAVLLYREA